MQVVLSSKRAFIVLNDRIRIINYFIISLHSLSVDSVRDETVRNRKKVHVSFVKQGKLCLIS